MLKLNRITDYAVVVLAQMAREPERLVTAPQLAQDSAMPTPTVAKVLKDLAREGVLESERGAHGVYRLARPPGEITVLQIIRALEGPVSLTACVDGTEGNCDVETLCPMRGNWDRVNRAIRTALEGVSLAEMAIAPTRFDLAPARVPHPAAS